MAYNKNLDEKLNAIPTKKRTSDARIRANAKYANKTYKKRTIYIKLKDLEKIDAYLEKEGLTCTQFFCKCLREKGVIDQLCIRNLVNKNEKNSCYFRA